ncbi:50S ribosomal subunit protein L3 [Desulfovibrionales bacterium]
MALGILGRKLGMTRLFNSDGTAIACTVVVAGPCPIVQIKEQDRDGYSALQLAFGETRNKLVNKPELGHLKKAGKGVYKHLREFRMLSCDGYTVGQHVTVEIFSAGEKVRVTGTSKGKGFQGAMKRWNFSGMPDSHGHEKVHRSVGSVGNCTFPGKIMKGKKMPGQMGNKLITTINLEVFAVRPVENILIIHGAIPGPKNGLVIFRKAEL